MNFNKVSYRYIRTHVPHDLYDEYKKILDKHSIKIMDGNNNLIIAAIERFIKNNKEVEPKKLEIKY